VLAAAGAASGDEADVIDSPLNAVSFDQSPVGRW
jgi:hypothetical protein